MMPRIPLGTWTEVLVDWIDCYFGWLFDGIADVLNYFVNGFQDILLFIPPILLIVIVAVFAWFATRKNLQLGILTAIGLLLVLNLELWAEAMETVALVLASTVIVLSIGIPLGILAGNNDHINMLLRPFLDLMQTMPSFVYLIPAVIFFGLGNVPGIIATVIFAMPPSIRLTSLGMRQVSKELIEVADAFGATPWQKLFKVQLPVALPTIMAGVNQCIMLALSMTVIASMIGAGGLGLNVLKGIQRVDIGGGFEAGFCIVIIAIILDRITQNLIES